MGEELAEKIHESPNQFMRDKYTANERNLSFHFYEINDHHIGDAIPKIKTSKGFENDNVSSYFLKIALPHIKNFLVYMFKKYIEKGLFLLFALLKMARVTLIFKDKDESA